VVLNPDDEETHVRALQIEKTVGPEGMRLVDVPEPESGDDLLIEVHAAGVTFPDLLLSRGEYQYKPDPPFTPGNEVAGVVTAAPSTSALRPGDRVVAAPMIGGFAETVAVPVPLSAPLPAGLDFAEGAALVCNYHTAHFALHRRARLVPGETVVVLGAAGGVGTASIQVAKGLGARVVAVVRRPGAEDFLRGLGADEVIAAEPGWRDRVKELTAGRGADVVVDPVGGDTFAEGLRALAPEGRILVVGFAGGGIPELKVNRLLLRNVSAVGVAWGALLLGELGLFAKTATALDAMVSAGVVRPPIAARYPLEDGVKALTDLTAGRILGKAVLEPR
jgi:NADPH:quinone reductase